MLSEFLEHALGDSEAQKQDGELRGFGALERPAQDAVPPPADPAPARWPLRQRAGDAALPWLPLAVHDRAQGQGFVHGLAGVPRAPCPESLAHVFNTLARFTRQLRDLYRQFGVRGAIAFIRSSCAASWLDPARMRVLLAKPFLLPLE
ncbi:MAG: hypothetical protein IPK02_00165 [Candidatus Accumulibacter sp.]|uniref:Uncharacterized protein n=1 Tax=Candidatus Accumulibacter affinis TaxID=2954384 RepID=A0A935T589_9PROT|nr:hypothetical protein [Candidatus Accumulibacter affinis]